MITFLYLCEFVSLIAYFAGMKIALLILCSTCLISIVMDIKKIKTGDYDLCSIRNISLGIGLIIIVIDYFFCDAAFCGCLWEFI